MGTKTKAPDLFKAKTGRRRLKATADADDSSVEAQIERQLRAGKYGNPFFHLKGIWPKEEDEL